MGPEHLIAYDVALMVSVLVVLTINQRYLSIKPTLNRIAVLVLGALTGRLLQDRYVTT